MNEFLLLSELIFKKKISKSDKTTQKGRKLGNPMELSIMDEISINLNILIEKNEYQAEI